MAAGSVTLGEIVARDWSLMLDSTANGGPGSGIGRVVQGLDDVGQCVKIILTTPKGADPLRPTFGADLWRYVDAPISIARAGLVREITEAITLWEPRIDVVKVTTTPIQSDLLQPGAHLSVDVVWRIKLTGGNLVGRTTQNTTITLTR